MRVQLAPAAKGRIWLCQSDRVSSLRSKVKQISMEAALRFELRVEVLQTSALPLGYAAPKGSHFS